MAGTRALSSEQPRSTAYYYADLERLKRKSPENADELSEYVVANEVVNDIPAKEVPPFRDRQWSLPEYSTPENSRKGETYSTAGTFPMPEPKEKEPLLAELEAVGRLPLTQLESSSGVRRSRSWYLCCPNVGEEEISRDSSWRYSSLRPVTVPPLPGQNGLSLVATQSSSRTDDLASLRAERDALARALAGERARAASAARAHDARLAELHGVIAELVRRRAQDKHAGAIPEEEVSDECESTTQPAGELDDADRSRTEQNESSSILSPCELPTPQEKVDPLPDDTTDTSSRDVHIRLEPPCLDAVMPECDVSLNLSERDSDVCLNTRCCEVLEAGGSSCEREHGSTDARPVYTASPGRCESRQAKIASRVKLKRTEETECKNQLADEEAWCTEAAERLALDVCAQADLREALVTANNDGEAMNALARAWRVRCSRLQADCAVLQGALARAADTAHRLYTACSVSESACVGACLALRAADRALEVYDVLLALAETQHSTGTDEREAAELIAGQLLARLDSAPTAVSVGSPLLSPGPWLQHTPYVDRPCTLIAGQLLARLDSAPTAVSVGSPLLSPGPWLQHTPYVDRPCTLIAGQLLARLDSAPTAVSVGSPLLSPGPWLQHTPYVDRPCTLIAGQLLARLDSAPTAVSVGSPLLSPGPWLQHTPYVDRPCTLIAGQLLARLDSAPTAVSVGSPLLSPGPWLQHTPYVDRPCTLIAGQLLARLDSAPTAVSVGSPLLSPGPWLQHTPYVDRPCTLIAGQLLARLDSAPTAVSVGSPLLSPGPWLQHTPYVDRPCTLIAGQLLARLDSAPTAVSVGSPLLSPGPWLQHTPYVDRPCTLIAGQLLARLDSAPTAVSVGSPLLSPGPWLQHTPTVPPGAWDRVCEARLRRHAAALKAETVALRAHAKPDLFTYHDIEEDEIPKSVGNFNMADMEAAVMLQEVLAAKEAIAIAHANSLQTNKHTNSLQTNKHTNKPRREDKASHKEHKSESTRSRRRHWLDTQASETDL